MVKNEDIESLYIIGNGFDLHHKIQCKYSDFHKWLCLNNPMLENRLFQVYELHHNDFWSSFETNLGALTVESILEGYAYAPMLLFAKHANGDMIALKTDNYTGSIGEIGYTLERLFNDLQIAFADWIFQLEDANPTYKIQIDKSKSSFISFNYTQTLEQVYGVNPSDILYLHGCSAWDTNLIFGHNLTPEKLLKNWQNNYSEEELEVLIGAANEMSIIFKDVDGRYVEKDGIITQSTGLPTFNPSVESFNELNLNLTGNVLKMDGIINPSKANELFAAEGLEDIQNAKMTASIYDDKLEEITWNYDIDGMNINQRLVISYNTYTIVPPAL